MLVIQSLNQNGAEQLQLSEEVVSRITRVADRKRAQIEEDIRQTDEELPAFDFDIRRLSVKGKSTSWRKQIVQKEKREG